MLLQQCSQARPRGSALFSVSVSVSVHPQGQEPCPHLDLQCLAQEWHIRPWGTVVSAPLPRPSPLETLVPPGPGGQPERQVGKPGPGALRPPLLG